MRDMDCRWITCDQHFKYNTCLKRMAFADALYDRFEAEEFKYPECAILYGDACDHTDSCGFENVRRPDGTKEHDAEKDDAEAKAMAEKLVSELSEEALRDIYLDLAAKAADQRHQALVSLEKDICSRLDDLGMVASGADAPEESFSEIVDELESFGDRPPPRRAWLDIADRLRRWYARSGNGKCMEGRYEPKEVRG